MALADHLAEEKLALTILLESEYQDLNLRQQLLDRLFLVRSLLGELAGIGGSVTINGGDASAVNQLAVQSTVGAVPSKVVGVQGVVGGVSVPVVFSASLPTGSNTIGAVSNTAFGISGTLPAFASTPTVNIGTAPNLTFTNTAFTANAGTNLNTSLLALESGGNLAAVNAKLPSSLGEKTKTGSVSITPASDAVFTLASESGFLTLRNTALSNTAVAIKATPGSVMGWNLINVNTVPVYVKFYNIVAGSVTVGTSPVTLTMAVPAGSINLVTPDLVPFEVFSTAISFACVTGLADNSNTAPVTPIHASVRYK